MSRSALSFGPLTVNKPLLPTGRQGLEPAAAISTARPMQCHSSPYRPKNERQQQQQKFFLFDLENVTQKRKRCNHQVMHRHKCI